jgi:hypothetical protein
VNLALVDALICQFGVPWSVRSGDVTLATFLVLTGPHDWRCVSKP